MRNPHALDISDQIRQNVRRDLPILEEMKNAEMRDWVIEAWATSLYLNGFTAVHELQGSGLVDVLVEKEASQAEHLCGVASIAKGIGEALIKKNPDYEIDTDLLIAGALLHDVGKPPEYNMENKKKWMEVPYKAGNPPASHAMYGYYICMLLELPTEICCIPANHCSEGDLHNAFRSIACTIVHYADWMYWDCLKVLGGLDPTYSYKDVLWQPYQTKTDYSGNFHHSILKDLSWYHR